VGVPQGVYGLENIDFDRWTETLAAPVKSEGTGVIGLPEFQKALVEMALGASSEQKLFSGVLDLIKKTNISESGQYFHLAEILLEARQEVQHRINMAPRTKQDAMFLMQMLAEEALYVGKNKFASFPQEISLVNSLPESPKVGSLRSFRPQTGDVVLSKATGYGSSAVIALAMSHPHIFSHSTPVYIDHNSLVLSPEAETEDGVKLRNMVKDYASGSKTRMYIYRYVGADSSVVPRVQDAAQKMIDEMYQRTGGDPFNKAAYKYDYSMTPGDVESRGMFCSGVALELYTRAGYTGRENPYPKNMWSSVTKTRETLLKTLNMNTDRVPAPGDLELNPEFQLVGLRLDIGALAQERIEAAIIESVFRQLQNNPKQLKQITDALLPIGNNIADKEQLRKLFKSGLLPKEFSAYEKNLDAIPPDINYKQLVFFAFVNEVLTPKLRQVMTAQVKAELDAGHIVGLGRLRVIAEQDVKGFAKEIKAYVEKLEKAAGPLLCKAIF
jgi:hypothetical protein